jgi:hypothetical protein
MLRERTNGDAATDLRVRVERIRDEGDLAGLSDQLDRLADSLRATGGAYEAAASRLVPPADPLDRGITSRYRRAAAAWPAAASPSHERLAAALASLHAAADAARLAGRRGDQARRAVDALWEGDHRSATP